METLIIIFQFLIFAAIIVAYFLIKNLFPSYFSEKGKNLATKEDIEEITQKIKTVESKISIKTSSEIDYQSLKRKIILDFFATYNVWERLISDARSNTGEDSEIKNEILIQKIKDAKLNYNFKEGEIEIFIDDEELFLLRTEVTIKLLKLQHELEKHCDTIDFIVKSETDLQLKFEKIREERRRYSEILIDKMTDFMPDRNKLIQYLEEKLKESFN